MSTPPKRLALVATAESFASVRGERRGDAAERRPAARRRGSNATAALTRGCSEIGAADHAAAPGSAAASAAATKTVLCIAPDESRPPPVRQVFFARAASRGAPRFRHGLVTVRRFTAHDAGGCGRGGNMRNDRSRWPVARAAAGRCLPVALVAAALLGRCGAWHAYLDVEVLPSRPGERRHGGCRRARERLCASLHATARATKHHT